MKRYIIANPRKVTVDSDGNNGHRSGAVAPTYAEILVTHWAEAVVNGPIRNISRYDEAAKLLVTIAAPVQMGLFALYDKVGMMDKSRPLPLILACSFPIASVLGVVYYVVRVCDERLKLIMDITASGELQRKGPAACEQKETDFLSLLYRLWRRIWKKPDCQPEGDGILSYLLATSENPNFSADMVKAVKKWEEHVEFVATCKHKYLVRAAYCFVAGALTPLLMLIILAAWELLKPLLLSLKPLFLR
jgi:hypothetical protein